MSLKAMSLKALIADDNLIMRNLIKYYLQPYKFEIHEAKDGVEALSFMKKNDMDILFLDINMPNIDGFNVAKYIEVPGKHPTIISISSDLTRSNIIVLEELGVQYFLNKPLNIHKFKDIIDEILSLKEEEDKL